MAVDIADRYRPGATPGDWTGMVWRLGRTAIVTPGPFSDLSGHDRVQVVVAGSGLTLRAAHGPVLDLREPFRPVRFPGDWAIASELGSGPVEVVNLIGARDRVALDLRVLRAGEEADVPSGEHVLYAPAGEVVASVEGSPVTLANDGAAQIANDGPLKIGAERGICLLASVERLPPSASC